MQEDIPLSLLSAFLKHDSLDVAQIEKLKIELNSAFGSKNTENTTLIKEIG
jgi:hypothetical protein